MFHHLARPLKGSTDVQDIDLLGRSVAVGDDSNRSWLPDGRHVAFAVRLAIVGRSLPELRMRQTVASSLARQDVREIRLDECEFGLDDERAFDFDRTRPHVSTGKQDHFAVADRDDRCGRRAVKRRLRRSASRTCIETVLRSLSHGVKRAGARLLRDAIAGLPLCGGRRPPGHSSRAANVRVARECSHRPVSGGRVARSPSRTANAAGRRRCSRLISAQPSSPRRSLYLADLMRLAPCLCAPVMRIGPR